MGYTHLYFSCPYFKWDKPKEVGCEGKTVLRFPDALTCNKHLKAYCAGQWKQCTYAKALNEFYERKYDGNDNKGTTKKN